VIGAQFTLRRLAPLWLSAWPLWALAAFAGLAIVRWLPAGYSRAVVAAPILLMVPGSVTLGCVFHPQRRPRAVAFACFAVLLSAVWSAFASLILYVRHVPITAGSTYLCLLIICALLAIAAQARLVLASPGRGRRAARQRGLVDPFDAEANAAEMPAAKGARLYAIAVSVAGVSLLAGGLYAYDHHPHPAPVGYTWIDWTGLPVKGDVAVAPTGTKLDFQIVHHEPETANFRLSAAWLGTPSRPLAKPVTVSIGPDRIFNGALFIPPLPDGCTYRIVVTLSAARQIDPLTKKPQSWALNADVHDPSKSTKSCR
jgi:hypothetical protein